MLRGCLAVHPIADVWNKAEILSHGDISTLFLISSVHKPVAFPPSAYHSERASITPSGDGAQTSSR